MDQPATPPEPAPDFDAERLPRIGEIIDGKYRVERLLGTGGMGLVVEVTHVKLREPMALKLLRPEAAKRATLVSRFQREARAAVRIKSEHVARVSDVGALATGDPYMVMELLTGADLQQLCRERGPLPVGEAVEYVAQACAGVEAAHALGVIHRDLKPGNLFLTRRADGSPLIKVVDFGVSKILEPEGERKEESLTSADGLLGSPLYMSPEQIRYAKGVDARADVWSLGAILYRLLAGRAPFDVGSIAQILVSIVSDEPEPLRVARPELPAALEAIVMRCLEKDHKRRIQSAAELGRQLSPFRPGAVGLAARVEPAPAPPPAALTVAAPAPLAATMVASSPSAPAPRGAASRLPVALGLGAGLLMVLLGGLLAQLLFGKAAASSAAPGPSASASAPAREVPRSPVETSEIAPPSPSAPAALPAAVESAHPLLAPAAHPSAPASLKGKPRIDPLGDRL